MAQYLFAGRISEIAGKYQPKRTDYQLLTLKDGDKNDVEAVMFIVQTAKRDGMRRPIALPLRKDYEPWSEELYQYYANCKQTYPFSLHENPETSKKYAMTAAKKMFAGFHYPYESYSRQVEHPYTKEMIIHQRYSKRGLDEYLVELPDGSRAWTTSQNTIHLNVKVEPRFKPCTSHTCRKRRNLTLAMNHMFDSLDRAIYTGQTEKSEDKSVPDAQKYYMWLDMGEMDASAILMLTAQAKRYFPKLCVEYDPMI